jgi:MFS family permease
MSDQVGRKPLIYLGILLFLLGSVIAALSENIFTVIIGRALQGGGAISAVLMSFLADYVRPEQRSKANAFVGAQIGLAFMLSLILGPVIASTYGISGLFWFIGGLSLLALVIATQLPQVSTKAQYSLTFSNFKKILTPTLIRLDLSVFVIHLILTCSFIVLPLLLVENNIFDKSLHGNWKMYLPVMILSFIGMLPLIISAEKFKKHKLVLILTILILITSQLLFYTLDLTFTSFMLFLTLFFVAFNGIEAMLPSLLSRTADPDKRGLAMGVFSTSQFFGSFIGGVFGGWIYHKYGINSVFLFTISIAIIWLVFMSNLNLNFIKESK